MFLKLTRNLMYSIFEAKNKRELFYLKLKKHRFINYH